MSDSPRSGRWDILVPHCNDPEGGSTSNGEQDPVPWGSLSQSLLKTRYSNLAEACGEAAVDLRSVKAGEIGEGDVADALQELVGKLPGLLEDAKETFQGAADAFEAWGEALDTARRESYSVLTDAQTAYEALEDKDDWDEDREIYVTRLNTVLSTMSGDVDTAVNALDELMRNGWDKAWDLWNKVVEWTEENPLVYAALMVVAGIAAIFIPGIGIGIALGIIGLLVSATSLHRQDKLGFNLHSAAVLGFDAIGVIPGGAFVRNGAATGGRFLSSQRGPISGGLRSAANSIRNSPLGTSVRSTLNRGSEIRQSINSGTFNNSPRQSLAANAALGGLRDGGIGAAGGTAAEVTDTGDSSFSSVAQAAGLGFATGAPTGAVDGAHSNNGFQAAWQGDSSVLTGGGVDAGGGVGTGGGTDVGGATDTGGTTDVSGSTDGGGETTSASEGATGGDSSGTGSTPADAFSSGAPASGEPLTGGADMDGAPATGEAPASAEASTTADPVSTPEATPGAPASETPTADPTPTPESAPTTEGPAAPETPGSPEGPAAPASEAPVQDTGAPEGPVSEGGAPDSPASEGSSTDTSPGTATPEGPASGDRSPEPTTPAEPAAADTSLEAPAQGEPTPDASSHPSPASGDTPSQEPAQPSGDPANPAPGEGGQPGSRPGDAESPTLTSPEGQGDQSGQPTSGPEGSSEGRSDGSQSEAGAADAAARRAPAAAEPQPATPRRPAPEDGPEPSPASGEGRPGGQDAPPQRPVEHPAGQPAGEQPRGGESEAPRSESSRGEDTSSKPAQGHRDDNGNHTDQDRSGGRDGDDTGPATPREDQSAEPTADDGSGGDRGGDEPPRTGGDGDDAGGGDQGPENQPPQSILDAGLDTQNGRFPEGAHGGDPQNSLADYPLPPRDRLKDFASDGRILGVLNDENRVYRDPNDGGRITEVDGRPLQDWINDLTLARTNEMAEAYNNGQLRISKGGMGKGGAVNSIIVDRNSGIVAEGMNGGAKNAIPEGQRNEQISNAVDSMWNERGYSDIVEINDKNRHHVHEVVELSPDQLPAGVYDPKAEYGTLSPNSTPYGDDPYRHAEVKAANRILNFLEGSGGRGNIEDMQLDNRFTLKSEEGGRDRCPCCANCGTILRDASVPRAGRNTHAPWDVRNVWIKDD